MKTFLKFTALSAVLLMLAGGLVSCNEVESSSSPETLKGTSWKVVGIVDVKTGDLTELESSITITFIHDTCGFCDELEENTYGSSMCICRYCSTQGKGAFVSHVTSWSFNRCYTFDYETGAIQVVPVVRSGPSFANHILNQYVAALQLSRFYHKGSTLRLYYNDCIHDQNNNQKNYFLFKQIQP